MIPYSGRIAVDAVHGNGNGYFKFAFVNSTASTSYWSNDSTSSAGSEPAASIQTTLTSGRYQVVLGDTSLTNMNALDTSSFDPSDLYLRVWFSEDNVSFDQLSPDTRILPIYSALRAGISDDVID